MIKLSALPVQPLADGITVIKAVMGVLAILTAVKEGILPVPLAASPIAGLLFIQLKLVPLTTPVKLTGLVGAPAHIDWLAGGVTLGVGFTVIVNVLGVPLQMPATGVTLMVATAFTLPLLTAVKAGISPLPLAASPMEGLLFVQLKEVPSTAPANAMALVCVPPHKS